MDQVINFLHHGRINFNVPERYEQIRALGFGAEGFVCSALDNLRNRNVAIKKLLTPFESIARAKHVFREINIIKIVNHNNIVRLFDMFAHVSQQNGQECQDIYIVMDLMEMNLHQAIHRGAIDNHRRISFLMYQLLCGVNHLHSAGIIHRDIKPANILIRLDCTLKLADFGHSRGTSINEMTGYVTTRYYRAPEVIMRGRYDQKIDVWSVGCTMAEIIRRAVLFERANENQQIDLIIRTLGPQGRRFDEIFPDRIFPRNNRNEFLNANNARNLLSQMLVINPNNRITILQALNHDYIRVWIPRDRDGHNTDLNSPALGRYDDAVENTEHDINEWRHIIMDEIAAYRMRQQMN